MDMLNIFASNLLESSSNNRMCKDIIEYIRIVDILRPLLCAKHSDLGRKMRSRKQGIPLFICRNWPAVKDIVIFMQTGLFLLGTSAETIHSFGPRNHIVGVVIQHLQLRCKLTNVVSSRRARH